MPQDAVAAYEAKCAHLRSRVREQAEAHRQEVDALHEEITHLTERSNELEAAAAQLEASRCAAHRACAWPTC
jgi:predicted RNase H-like nuclease (RuvC/YqgF family)